MKDLSNSSSKTIILTIPMNCEVSKDIFTLTHEETYLVLKIGLEAVLQHKNIINVPVKIDTDIENDYKQKILILESQLQKIEALHKSPTIDLNKIVSSLKEKDLELDHYKKLVDKVIQKTEQVINHQNIPTYKVDDTSIKTTTIISQPKEKKFRSLALQAFRDFPEFEIIDLHTFDGQGDFILKFRDFCILTDSKIYTNNVNCKAREKLKQELIASDRCFFGWLVSMDTDIDRFDKSAFMFEWLSGNKCVTYINSLSNHEEPIELLRSIYFTCQTIYNITNVDATDITELHKLKENEQKIREISQKMLQNTIERDEILAKMKENFSRNDEMIRQLLNKETNQIVDKRFARILDWWNFHIINDEGHIMRSSNIWTMFKRDNPDLIGEIQANEFKDMIYAFISEDRIVKPRNKYGALEIKNIRWKVDRGNAEN
jgi:hypothetical protein